MSALPSTRLPGDWSPASGLLSGRGLTRFEQIAALTPDEVTAIDADLGAFKGRLTRDRAGLAADIRARFAHAGADLSRSA